MAKVICHHQQHYLGMFNTQEAAARAYDKRLLALKGIHAWPKLNFPSCVDGDNADDTLNEL